MTKYQIRLHNEWERWKWDRFNFFFVESYGIISVSMNPICETFNFDSRMIVGMNDWINSHVYFWVSILFFSLNSLLSSTTISAYDTWLSNLYQSFVRSLFLFICSFLFMRNEMGYIKWWTFVWKTIKSNWINDMCQIKFDFTAANT